MPEEPTSSGPVPRRMTIAGWLFNPFLHIAGGQALAIGLLGIVAAGVAAAAAGVHFPGLLDFRNTDSAQLWVPVAQGLVNWFAIAALFGLVSVLIAPKTVRLVDIAGTQALARWPLLPAALVSAVPSVRQTGRELAAAAAEGELVAPEGWGFLVAGLVTTVCVVWTVQLMWKAFSVSCNQRGGRAVAFFIGVIVVGEVVTTFVGRRIVGIGS